MCICCRWQSARTIADFWWNPYPLRRSEGGAFPLENPLHLAVIPHRDALAGGDPRRDAEVIPADRPGYRQLRSRPQAGYYLRTRAAGLHPVVRRVLGGEGTIPIRFRLAAR